MLEIHVGRPASGMWEPPGGSHTPDAVCGWSGRGEGASGGARAPKAGRENGQRRRRERRRRRRRRHPTARRLAAGSSSGHAKVRGGRLGEE